LEENLSKNPFLHFNLCLYILRNWSKYREIMDIGSADIRKICEQKILSGELKTDGEIRKFKKAQKMKE